MDAKEIDKFIAGYANVRNEYVNLATELKLRFEEICREVGVSAIIESRAKELASFAEKMLRPGKHYTSPLDELCDLCGVRVITYSLADLTKLIAYVKKAFQLEAGAYEDKMTALGAAEFGYLSHHFTLTVDGKKAELQLRTLIQHIWAVNTHEISYKNPFTLPVSHKRSLHRIAAILEEADRGFDKIRSDIAVLQSVGLEQLSTEDAKQEIRKLLKVLEIDKSNVNVAHRLGQLYGKTLEQWDRAIEIFEKIPESTKYSPSISRDWGVALCKANQNNKRNKQFEEGQQRLLEAISQSPSDVDALCSLAGTWKALEHEAVNPDEKKVFRDKARRYYQDAYKVDSSDPYALGNYLEYEIAAYPNNDVDVLNHFWPMINNAIDRCFIQIDFGANYPWAFFDVGKFKLFLGDRHLAVAFYSIGVLASTADWQLKSADKIFDVNPLLKNRLEGSDAICYLLSQPRSGFSYRDALTWIGADESALSNHAAAAQFDLEILASSDCFEKLFGQLTIGGNNSLPMRIISESFDKESIAACLFAACLGIKVKLPRPPIGTHWERVFNGFPDLTEMLHCDLSIDQFLKSKFPINSESPPG